MAEQDKSVIINMSERSFITPYGEIAPKSTLTLGKAEAERLAGMYPAELRIAAEIPAARPAAKPKGK